MENFLFPLPEASLLQRFTNLFDCIYHRSSASFVGLPESAKSGYLQFLLGQPNLIKKLLNDRFESTILVYFSPLSFEENNHFSWLYQLNATLAEVDSSYTYVQSTDPALISSSIKHYLLTLHKNGKHCVFLINNQSYWESLPSSAGQVWKMFCDTKRLPPNPACSLIFLTHTSPYTLQQCSSFFRELSISTQEQVCYFPLQSKEESQYTIRRFANFAHATLTPTIANIVIESSGGYYPCIRDATRILTTIKKITNPSLATKLYEHEGIRFHLQRLWESLDDQEKYVIKRIVSGKSVNLSPHIHTLQHLLQTRVISPKGTLNIPWFEAFIHDHLYSTPLTSQDMIAFPYLSGKERMLVLECMKRKGEIISRETIADIIWDERSDEKYSDWAIDKTMSRIRKRMKQHQSSVMIHTIKGKGYQLL